ncbi:MAG: hypothetical protein ACFFAN_12880 [Promethearchaeota archaeon]
MSLLKKIKETKSSRLVSHIFVFIILIYSLALSVLFSSVLISLNRTIESIKVPDGYFKGNFNSSNPELEFPFSIENEGIYEVSDFSVKVCLKVLYFEENNDKEKDIDIFSKKENYGVIHAGQFYEGLFKGDEEDFDIPALDDFWNDVNIYEDVDFLIDIKISGKYFFGTIPFSVIMDDVNLEDLVENSGDSEDSECPTCS